MAGLTRRRFMLLSAVALVGAAACSAPQETGLRGSGTVLYPRDAEPQSAPPARDVEPTPVAAVPTRAPIPTPAEREPILPPDALPAATAGGTEAEMHVVPVPTKPPIAAA